MVMPVLLFPRVPLLARELSFVRGSSVAARPSITVPDTEKSVTVPQDIKPLLKFAAAAVRAYLVFRRC